MKRWRRGRKDVCEKGDLSFGQEKTRREEAPQLQTKKKKNKNTNPTKRRVEGIDASGGASLGSPYHLIGRKWQKGIRGL